MEEHTKYILRKSCIIIVIFLTVVYFQYQMAIPRLQTLLQNRTLTESRPVPARHAIDRKGNSTFLRTHFMTVLPAGRTGNIMFQVAALFGTAIKHGYRACVIPSGSIKVVLDIFMLPNLTLLKPSNTRTFHEVSPRKFDKRINILNHSSNWTLDGFFQSWRYFEGIEDVIRNVFKFKDHVTSKVIDFLDNLANRDVQRVGVHVRRGDFANHEAIRKRGHISAPVSYISDAMNYFRKKYNRVHFFVASDDKKWCQENLKFENTTFSPFDSVGYDIALLALSDHVIITAGTFGWWGGWLAKGEIVYWKGYPPKGSSLESDTILEDYYPNDWVGLP